MIRFLTVFFFKFIFIDIINKDCDLDSRSGDFNYWMNPGIKNVGNSCYINVLIQCLSSVPRFCRIIKNSVDNLIKS